MITPLDPCDNPRGGFVVADIENAPDGRVIEIDTAWRPEGGAIFHRTDYSWETWWNFIRAKARKDKRFRTIYAHNGGGWDWVSFAAYLIRSGRIEAEHMTACPGGSKFITMAVQIPGKCTVCFADSLQLLRSSLEKLAPKFTGEHKRKPPEEFRQDFEAWRAADPEGFRAYLHQDTELLLKVLEKAFELIRDNVAKIDALGWTIGSTALKVFKTIGLDEPIFVPTDPELRGFLRSGYTGGRVECFQPGHFSRVRVYDVNSLYPYAMKSARVPTSARGGWNDKLDLEGIGVVHCTFEQRNRKALPVLSIAGVGQWSGEGVFFTPELKLLKEIDPKASITIHRAFEFYDTGRVFSGFVDRLYALRQTDPSGPLGELCKFLLNSCYGKFGQHSTRTKIVWTPLSEIYRHLPRVGMGTYTPINDEAEVYGLTADSECRFEHVGIAGTITSVARTILYDGIRRAGFGSVVYCDTDSVHTTNLLPPDLVGPALGQFKHEFDGEGVYAGKKLYALRDTDGKTNPAINACFWPPKIRAKGVSLGGTFGGSVSFDDMRRIAEGEKRTVKFRQPATVLEVLSGRKTPCQFYERQRTIQRTAGKAVQLELDYASQGCDENGGGGNHGT